MIPDVTKERMHLKTAPRPRATPAVRLALIAAAAIALPTLDFAVSPPAVPVAEHVVVYRHEGQYAAFPVLYQLHDEFHSLYIEVRARVSHSHLEPRAKPLAFVSTDGGRTWAPSPQKEYNPDWRTPDGELLEADGHGWRYVDPAERPALEARGIEVRASPDGRITYANGCYVRNSADHGATWSERELSVPREALIMVYNDPCTWLRVDGRTLLRAVYGRPTANLRFYESWLLRSTDGGRTWDFGTIAADPHRKRSFGETAIAAAANGDIVAMMRTEPALGTNLWMARSADRGRTWSPPTETPLQGHPAHLLRLHDGRLLCTYGFRDEPIGIRAAISRDDGRTWRAEDVVSLRSDGFGRPSDNGYPITTELADGALVTSYYITHDDGITGVEVTRWQPPWQ